MRDGTGTAPRSPASASAARPAPPRSPNQRNAIDRSHHLVCLVCALRAAPLRGGGDGGERRSGGTHLRAPGRRRFTRPFSTASAKDRPEPTSWRCVAKRTLTMFEPSLIQNARPDSTSCRSPPLLGLMVHRRALRLQRHDGHRIRPQLRPGMTKAGSGRSSGMAWAPALAAGVCFVDYRLPDPLVLSSSTGLPSSCWSRC